MHGRYGMHVRISACIMRSLQRDGLEDAPEASAVLLRALWGYRRDIPSTHHIACVSVQTNDKIIYFC